MLPQKTNMLAEILEATRDKTERRQAEEVANNSTDRLLNAMEHPRIARLRARGRHWKRPSIVRLFEKLE
jgi:hypothetical protein